jgi:hypothetical protein
MRSLFCLAVLASVGFSLGLSQMPPQLNAGMPGNGRTSQGFAALPEAANPHPDGVRALQDLDRIRNTQKRFDELNGLRHKELTSDTEKLVELANEVKTVTEKTEAAKANKDSGKETVSMLEVRKVEQIEKLAHAVRDKMRATIGD